MTFRLKDAMSGVKCQTRDGKLAVVTIEENKTGGNKDHWPLRATLSDGRSVAYTLKGKFDLAGDNRMDLVMSDSVFGRI